MGMFKLPSEFENRMRALLGETEYEAFRASYDEKERARGLRLNPLKIPKAWESAGDVAPTSAAPDNPATCRERCYPWEEPHVEAPAVLDAFHLRPIPWASYGFYYPEEERPGKSPLHEAGLYYLQEPSAMAVATLAAPRPGEKVLDLCAAPGGKSTMLAGMLMGEGLLVSNEIHPQRARILSQNVERMGIPNAIVTNETPEHLAEHFASYFDCVVVDAPCSGEGMFRKEEQALELWSVENVKVCAARQRQILDQAAKMVGRGGRLVYSTCTFAPEEDEQTIADFCRRHPEFTIWDVPRQLGDRMQDLGFSAGRPEWSGSEHGDENGNESGHTAMQEIAGTIRLWPHRLDGEGHFAAVLVKDGTSAREPAPVVRAEDFLMSFPGEKRSSGGHSKAKGGRRTVGKKENESAASSGEEMLSAARAFLRETIRDEALLQIAEKTGGVPKRFGEDLYLMPYGQQIATDGLRVLRPGLWLGTMQKGRFVPSHSLAMSLHAEDVRQVLELPAESAEAARYLRGESLPCDPSRKGWVLVTTEGISLGWGKASGGMLRNHYPKGLRRMA